MTLSDYIWFDLETSGKDPLKDVIYEVAAVITDPFFKEVAHFKHVVKGNISLMDDFVRDMHTKSNLIKEIPHGVTIDRCTDMFVFFLKKYFSEEQLKNKLILSGNTISFDRGFIKVHMPELEQCLSHRMCDISGAARFLNEKCHVSFSTGTTTGHRALDDARGSLETAKNIQKTMFEFMDNDSRTKR